MNSEVDDMAQLMASPAGKKGTRLRLQPPKLDGYEVEISKRKSPEETKADDAKTTKVKINEYTLNKEKQIKRTITKLSHQSNIEMKDNGGQYTMTLCPPTYFVIISKMVEKENEWGINVEGGNFDRMFR